MTLQGTAKDQLRTIVSRIERLEDDKAAIGTDLKEVYAEAKGNGFDTKALRKLIALRKKDESTRREEEVILSTYMHALGMQPDLFDEPEPEPEDGDGEISTRETMVAVDPAKAKSEDLAIPPQFDRLRAKPAETEAAA